MPEDEQQTSLPESTSKIVNGYCKYIRLKCERMAWTSLTRLCQHCYYSSFLLGLSRLELAGNWNRNYMLHVILHVICDMLHVVLNVICDMLHVILHVICNMLHVILHITSDMLHMTCDIAYIYFKALHYLVDIMREINLIGDNWRVAVLCVKRNTVELMREIQLN